MRTVMRPVCTEALVCQVSGIAFKTVPHWYGGAARNLYMDLLLPKDNAERKALPVIVWACGGAFMQMDRNVWMPAMIDFAKAGFAVASFDYRTAPVWPFPAAVEDIRSAVRYLRAHSAEYGLDPDRIATMGESAGGYLACMAALGGSEYDVGEHLDKAGSVQAVVDFYGKVDFFMEGEDPGCNEQVNKIFLGGQGTPESVTRMCCRNLVTEDTCPMLLLHGDRDPLVPVEESEALYKALIDHGVRSDLIIFEGAGHGESVFYQPEIKQKIIDFLREVM